ncbi:hypothetical protein vBCbaSRXM_129 [Citromicrobium phage vB_CbaS-RXM]|nr:hypothetical protein vBCbaSRXM_129 [Citromicrobium phage vB_CbaS-RXM]
MALPLALPAAATIKAFFLSKRFLIPAGIIALLLAIGAGTYFYINKQTDEKVEMAVEAADSNATIQTYETKAKVDDATVTIDIRMDELERRTIRDYSNVRNQIQAAPVEEREAPVPPLIIDTLNELDRLHGERDASRMADAELPSG